MDLKGELSSIKKHIYLDLNHVFKSSYVKKIVYQIFRSIIYC